MFNHETESITKSKTENNNGYASTKNKDRKVLVCADSGVGCIGCSDSNTKYIQAISDRIEYMSEMVARLDEILCGEASINGSRRTRYTFITDLSAADMTTIYYFPKPIRSYSAKHLKRFNNQITQFRKNKFHKNKSNRNK